MKISSILVVKMSSIGDVIHTMIPVSLLKRKIPDLRISWLIKEFISPILKPFPYVDEIISARKVDISLLNTLKNKNFDVAMDFQGLLKTSLITFLSGAKLRVGWDYREARERFSSLFYNVKINAPTKKHIVEKSICFLEAFGIYDGEFPEIEFNFSEKLKRKIDALVDRKFGKRKFVIINPGGNWITKRWMPEKFGELSNLIFKNHSFGVGVIFGPNEREFALKIAEISPSVSLFDLTLEELFYFISKCEIYIGGDTGPTHMASILDKKVLGIYGPTSPQRNGPFSKNYEVIYRGVSCAPCYKRKCGNIICMEVGVGEVYEKFLKLLEE